MKVPDLVRRQISRDAEKPHVSSEVTEWGEELEFQVLRSVTHHSFPLRRGFAVPREGGASLVTPPGDGSQAAVA